MPRKAVTLVAAAAVAVPPPTQPPPRTAASPCCASVTMRSRTRLSRTPRSRPRGRPSLRLRLRPRSCRAPRPTRQGRRGRCGDVRRFGGQHGACALQSGAGGGCRRWRRAQQRWASRRVHPPPPLSQDVLAAVAPKKPAWDLKRDLQPRLDKLERRTQRAIADILREQARGRGSSGFRPRQPPARCPPTPTAARYRPSHPPTAPLPQERAQLAADGGPRE